MKPTLSNENMNKIVQVEHHDPFSVLGNHLITENGKAMVAVRAFDPHAEAICVVEDGTSSSRWDMRKIHKKGLFETIIRERSEIFSYRLEKTFAGGTKHDEYDPYSFMPIISDYDLYLFNEGTHHHLYDRFGAHVTHLGDVSGVVFTVWAPSAKRVSVVGDFNRWDGRIHSMRMRGESGVWELFIPGLKEETIYKYEIKTLKDDILLKSDPFAFFGERRPKTASIVANLDSYQWQDQDWMEKRKEKNPLSEPISIYEVHLGSWKRRDDKENPFFNYRELADWLVDYVKETGFTHIELLPIMAHPFDASWGYQVTGYFSTTPRFGRPEDFMYMVDLCHRNGIGVILDWVPGHFPKDIHNLGLFDGTHLYEHADPRQGEHKEWGTLVFNYGRNEVKNFLIAGALFWFDKYHIDGMRVDAVASMLYLDYSRKNDEWIPNKYGGNENLEGIAFIREANEVIFAHHPGAIMSAEESTAWPAVSKPVYLGGLGFNLKWNMGWMHDTLLYISKDPIHRKFHQNLLTFSLLYAFHENFVLPLSHDEVVHGKRSLLSKMPGDYKEKFANLRLFLAYMYGHPGKKLLFMGNEFGQWNEWNFDQSLDWNLLDFEAHRGVKHLVTDLNKLLQTKTALYEKDFTHEGFEWIDINDTENSTLSFLRRGNDPRDVLIFVLNFTPIIRTGYRLGVPRPGLYREVLNTDSEEYGGSNTGNLGGCLAQSRSWHGREYSLELILPPLGAVVFQP